MGQKKNWFIIKVNHSGGFWRVVERKRSSLLLHGRLKTSDPANVLSAVVRVSWSAPCGFKNAVSVDIEHVHDIQKTSPNTY